MAEREERERAEREERERAKREEQELLRQEREIAEREERERKRLERERAEHEEQEREQLEREEQEREQLERERAEQEERERTEQLRREREEQKRLDEEKQRAEKERLRRQREEEEELLRQERLKLEEEELLRQQELASAEATETQTLSARVIYPYDAAEDNEMSLIEGEIIVNISQIDDGWWQGESKDGSRYGLFPANYVESIEGETELTTETSAKALYDYDAGEDNEISFKEDDILNDIKFVSEDWWQGTSPDGIIGLFP
ncbi:12701_t:CDS:2, partial [Racocetra persica]